MDNARSSSLILNSSSSKSEDYRRGILRGEVKKLKNGFLLNIKQENSDNYYFTLSKDEKFYEGKVHFYKDERRKPDIDWLYCPKNYEFFESEIINNCF